MAQLIYVLNGPNLNMLGLREPAIYGRDTLDDIRARCVTAAQTHGLMTDFRQSNVEGELVNWIQEARSKAQGIILNAGGYTHTSVAILDAILGGALQVHVHVPLGADHALGQLHHAAGANQHATGAAGNVAAGPHRGVDAQRNCVGERQFHGGLLIGGSNTERRSTPSPVHPLTSGATRLGVPPEDLTLHSSDPDLLHRQVSIIKNLGELLMA